MKYARIYGLYYHEIQTIPLMESDYELSYNDLNNIGRLFLEQQEFKIEKEWEIATIYPNGALELQFYCQEIHTFSKFIADFKMRFPKAKIDFIGFTKKEKSILFAYLL